MTKELEYIEELKLRYKEENGTVRRLNVIETALKRLDKYENKKIVGTTTCDKALEDFVISCSPTAQKKLKALEIIKEKPIVALVDYKYTYEEWLELVDEEDEDLFKNKEEYDLLKEVLL